MEERQGSGDPSAGASDDGPVDGGPADGGPADGTVAAGYRRSTGTPRGEARKQQLLDAVVDDLAVNGLVDFSLRRAARAAGATHKVLLYHFESADDLLAQSLRRLRDRRIDNALQAVAAAPGAGASLSERVRAIWPVLAADSSGLRVIDQAIGLAMYDPQRYAHLSREASEPYLDAMLSLLPADWDESRRRELAELLVLTFRGFLMEWRTTGRDDRIRAGLDALGTLLDREVSTPK